jgi:two-component system chemotaxis response regulator CheY
LVTAGAEQDNMLEAFQAGVNNYVVTPFNAATLQANLDKMFR